MNALSLENAKWLACPSQEIINYGNTRWNVKNSRNLHIEPKIGSDGGVYFKKNFSLDKIPENATVTASGLGIFEIYINGVRVGHVSGDKTVYDELKPGWTDYNKRVLSYTYDITSLLCIGENVVYLVATHGWWNERISRNTYGYNKNLVIASLSLDGEIINTDESWQSVMGGPVRFADIYDGEYFDARIPCPTDDPAVKWENAEAVNIFRGVITPAEDPFIHVRENLTQSPISAHLYEGTKDNGTDFGEVISLTKTFGKDCEKLTLKKGQSLVLDFGQNLVGRPHISVKASSGSALEIYCAELLNDSGSRARANDGPKGSAYIENYRSALSRIYYIANGSGDFENYFPKFTFFGFRYLELVCDGDFEIEFVKAEVIGSETRESATFECSNDEINRLYSNIIWGQRGNYLSVPTDCPQRDERLGWTGDTQVFCGAAAYNANVNGFFRKWVLDIGDTQGADGSVGDVIPSILGGYNNAYWGDAVIIVPYKIYLFYGDRFILEKAYPVMEKYMAKLATFPLGERPNAYGDWLAYDPTPNDFISTTSYANCALLISKVAKLLSESAGDKYALDSEKYYTLFEKIKAFFNEKYVEHGDLTAKTQCSYLLALSTELVDGDLRERCINALRDKIIENGYKLSTGFVGTAVLNQTLSAVGLDCLAYSLLCQGENPSWLYSLRQGATTIWERWNSYTLEGGFGDVNMNSYNHYAYGVVGEWMFESMAGIKKDDQIPAFKHFYIAPRPDLRTKEELPEGQSPITFVKATYDSVGGLIKSAWDISNGKFTLRATIPDGTVATFIFPLINGKNTVTVNGLELDAKVENGNAVFDLGAGEYTVA